MQHCFTYGSLMCEDIMAAVSGTRCSFVAASLDGYRRQPVLGQAYPGMVSAARAGVQGVLYLDLPASAWPRLDRFESEEYERRQVVVRLQDGRVETAWTYVFRPECAGRLVDGEWDFERFLRAGKASFTAQYVGFDDRGGDKSA
ncbi:MAG: hypothetical protein AzoDbin1_00839 [Azoarcus sp.]|nr:hypothetical protein [Azoarcus sp.]